MEVKNTNIYLKQLSSHYDYVTLVKSSKAKRNLHTHHGLYFNLNGKRWLAKTISKTITTMMKPKKEEKTAQDSLLH